MLVLVCFVFSPEWSRPVLVGAAKSDGTRIERQSTCAPDEFTYDFGCGFEVIGPKGDATTPSSPFCFLFFLGGG